MSKEYFDCVFVFAENSLLVRSAFDGETAHEVSKDIAFMMIFKEMVWV